MEDWKALQKSKCLVVRTSGLHTRAESPRHNMFKEKEE
jgi:hypothetical protein